MARDNTNPIRSAVDSTAKVPKFLFYAVTNGIKKLFTPSEWNYGEQAKRDIPKIPAFTKAVMKNGAGRFTGFFKGRRRGNDGPRE